MADPQLFDAGPPTAASNRYREGDRTLYRPPVQHGTRTNRQRNIEVRASLQVHLEGWLAKHVEGKPKSKDWGRARGLFAVHWVLLAQRLGIKVPGDPRKRTHRAGITPQRLREDAAKTNLRQFLEGKDLAEWALVGIEATVADRQGKQLPAGAYQDQGRLRL